MRQVTLQEIFLFFVGFISGIFLFLLIASSVKSSKDLKAQKSENSELVYYDIKRIFYEQNLANKLFNEVRVLCWVFTHPANHKTNVPHVRSTWGRRCNKLLFMSIESDPSQPDIIALPAENGRSHLWNKTRLAMKYVYENHFDDADWFMRADDDK